MKHNSGGKTNDKHGDMWSFLAFEKNITFFSVNFYILLAAVLALHFYNKANETDKISEVDQAKERERKNLLEMEKKRKKLQNWGSPVCANRQIGSNHCIHIKLHHL